RDLGGIIVIDFIDMVLESNRDLVLRRMMECLGRDRTRHQVAEVTSLGLVQMTRKRVGQGLIEVFSEPCKECGGRGIVITHDPVASKRPPKPRPPVGAKALPAAPGDGDAEAGAPTEAAAAEGSDRPKRRSRGGRGRGGSNTEAGNGAETPAGSDVGATGATEAPAGSIA
ncbi:MAG: ribonuclease, partial [Frankiaceae bacterium]|nr:ribonuclease [Frankiaceae bacterium]